MNMWVDFVLCHDTSEGKVARKLIHFCPVLPKLYDCLLGSLESRCYHSVSLDSVV